MSEPSVPVQCRRHGSSHATFICQHLLAGYGVGFRHAHDPDDPRPDAWCDACDARLMALGDWTDESEALAGVTMICAGCYDEVRRRNERVVVFSESGDDVTPERLWLRYLDERATVEPSHYRISSEEVTPPIYTAIYADTPSSGWQTAYTVGLSSLASGEADPTGPELVISVASLNPAWGLAVGYAASHARGRFDFPIWETYDFHAQIAEESAMSGFLIAWPTAIEPAARVFAGRTIIVAQMLPLYTGEVRWIREEGLDSFWEAADRAGIAWHDVRRVDLSRGRQGDA